jgi:DNA mismatch endonuclease (patch repair protein)
MIYFSDLLFSRQSIIPGFKRMTDIVDKETRSRMMSGIRGKNTKPEILIRKGLHALGFRYRLHSSKLPGKPDIVLPRYRAIILINGCFWHAHNCHLFKWPSTRKEFWEAKILSNKKRDQENLKQYTNSGWKTLVLWECALKGKARLPVNLVFDLIVHWIVFETANSNIMGKSI